MEKEIYELILAYLREDISEAEWEVLQKWVNENEKHKRLFAELSDREKLKEEIKQYSTFRTEGQWRRLEKSINNVTKKDRKIIVWKTCVASVTILLALGIGLFYYSTRSVKVKPELRVATIIPGEMQAVLDLGNGREIALKGIKNTAISEEKGNEIWVNENGELTYSLSEKSNIPETHTLRIPRGGEYKVTLDDGTEVWLNSATQFTYPAHFIGAERRVKIIGEAFFKVVQDSKRPFIVETDKMDVRVLGTSFNVTAYPDEEKSSTTLVIGKVEVMLTTDKEAMILSPGEQALIENGHVQVRKVNTKLYTSWMRDRFSFESEDMESVIRKLSRWYDVNVFFANSAMREKRFTGSLPKYEEIDQVLKIIEMTTDIHFTIKDKTIIVQ